SAGPPLTRDRDPVGAHGPVALPDRALRTGPDPAASRPPVDAAAQGPFPALAAAVRGRALGDTVCPLPGHAAVRIQGLGDTTWNPVDAPARDPAVDAARSPALAATARGLSLARVQDHAAARALAETADHEPT